MAANDSDPVGTAGTDQQASSDLPLDELDPNGPRGGDAEHLLVAEEEAATVRTAKELEAVYEVPVQLSAVLGRANMQVSQLLKLGRGAVVELDRKVGEAIDIYVNNRLVARGEVVVVEDRLGVTMTEIIKADRPH
jgi:flagellar motor switch protein FliN/FliY